MPDINVQCKLGEKFADTTAKVLTTFKAEGRIATSTTSTAFILQDVTDPGPYWIRNYAAIGSDEDITVLTGVGGTVINVCRAGSCVTGEFPSGVTAPAWQASSGTPEMEYVIYDT